MNGRLKIPLILFALAGVGAMIYFTGRVCLVVFMGVVLAVGLDALAHWTRRLTRLPRGGALLLVVLLIGGAIGGTSVLVGPMLSEQLGQIRQELPEAVREIESYLADRGWGKVLMSQVPVIEDNGQAEQDSGGASGEAKTQEAGDDSVQGGEGIFFPRQPKQRPSDAFADTDLLSNLTGVFSVTLSTLVNIAVLLVVGLYLAAQPDIYRRGITWLAPERHEAVTERLLHRIGRALRWWLFGRIVSMAIVGVLTGLGLWLLGLPLAFVLGLIAGLLSFIPNLGPILAAVPGILIGLMVSPWTAMWAAGIYAGVQFVESYFITPLIQERAVQIPPALLITVQLVMGVLAGIWGLLAATPLMVTVIVTVQTLYVRRQLHKPVPIMGSHASEEPLEADLGPSASGAHDVADDDDHDDDDREDRPRQ